MTKKRIVVKNAALKDLFRKGGRKGAKKQFFELVKRAASTTDTNN